MEVIVLGAYSYDRKAHSDAHGLDLSGEESLTVQSQAEEADINTIVKRFGLSGQLPENVRAPTYGDFSQVIDFRTAMDAVNSAQRSFNEMPADLRARFGNDPARFVDFCSQESNLEEMRKLGLAVPAKLPPPEVVQKVIVMNDLEDGDGGYYGEEGERRSARPGGSDAAAPGKRQGGRSSGGGVSQGSGSKKP